LYSNALATTAKWIDFGGLQINNSTTSPDGTQNASKLEYDGSITGAYQTISVTAGATYTASMYAKLDDATNICLVINNTSSWNTVGGISFTTSNGLIANQWARVQFTFTAPSSGVINWHIGNHSETGVTPQSVGSFFIWGCQVELSSYATSIIETTSASATRVADACSKTGISSLIGQTEGTIFVDVSGPSKTTDSRYIGVSNGSDSNRILFYQQDASTTTLYFQSPAGSGAIGFTTINGRMKMACAYKNNDFVVYCNGVLKTSTTSAPISMTLNTIYVGTYEDGTIANSLDQSINEAVIFKTRLTNAELASLTTL
jgi:hypothetical protein